MRLRVLDHPEALEEFAEQSDYLEAQSDGLGDRFIDRAEESLNDVLADPEAWVRVPYWNEQPFLYWRGIAPFRVHIVYYVDAETIRILAYAHESREPGYWRHRLANWSE